MLENQGAISQGFDLELLPKSTNMRVVVTPHYGNQTKETRASHVTRDRENDASETLGVCTVPVKNPLSNSSR